MIGKVYLKCQSRAGAEYILSPLLCGDFFLVWLPPCCGGCVQNSQFGKGNCSVRLRRLRLRRATQDGRHLCRTGRCYFVPTDIIIAKG